MKTINLSLICLIFFIILVIECQPLPGVLSIDNQITLPLIKRSLQNNTTNCPFRYTFDNVSQTCVQLCPYLLLDPVLGFCLPCHQGTILNETMNICVNICSQGTQYNSTTKSCQNVCPQGTIYVPGLTLGIYICENICGNDKFYNISTKNCSTCPKGTLFNALTNLCQNICKNQTVYNASLDKCVPCPPGYLYNNKISDCSRICSKGYIFDGLLGFCRSICQNGNFYNATSDACQPPVITQLSLNSYIKSPDSNDIIIQVSYQAINAVGRLLQTSAFTITTNFPYESITVASANQSFANIQIAYNQSLNDYTKMTITINNAPFSLPPVTDNNLALKYYSSEHYDTYRLFHSLIPFFTYGVLFLLLLTFLLSSKLIAMQTLLIFQFTYGGLFMMKKIQAMMYPYKQLWLFDGYNIFIEDDVKIPPNLRTMDFNANFISNFNINIAIFLLPSLIGYGLLLTHKILKKFKKRIRNNLEQYSQTFLGDWQLSTILICMQQLVFSFVINIQYSPEPATGIVIGVFLFFIYGLTVYKFYKGKMSAPQAMRSPFGHFKSFFEVNSHNFYILAMIYRTILSLILVLMSNSIVSQMLVLFWTVSWLAFLLIKRPYKKMAQLIPILNSFIIVLLAVFFLYQRNKADDAEINFSTYMPIAVLAALGVSCIFNTIYAGFHFHLNRIQRKKKQQIQKQMQVDKQVEVKIEMQSQTVQYCTQEDLTSQNISNLIAEMRNQSDKDPKQRPTTALKDISPIHPADKNEALANSNQISEINDKIRTISELVNEDGTSNDVCNST